MTQPAKSYYRLMLGLQSAHVAKCLVGGIISADFGIEQDLSGQLAEEWRQFNAAFIPLFLAGQSDKSKITSGLACGVLWTVVNRIRAGDMVLYPDGTGRYHVGEAQGDYSYAPTQVLPHCRQVRWLPIKRIKH